MDIWSLGEAAVVVRSAVGESLHNFPSEVVHK